MPTKAQHIQLRKKVQLLAKQGLNNTQIAKKLQVTRNFVIKWKEAKSISVDKRGWQKGKKRKYTDEQEQLVIQARLNTEQEFFLELRQSSRNYLKKRSRRISSKELSVITSSANLTARNKRVAQAIYSTQRNGYLNLEYFSRSTLLDLVISSATMNPTTSSVVNMSGRLNCIFSFGLKLKPAQRC